MEKKSITLVIWILAMLFVLASGSLTFAGESRVVLDAMQREVEVPLNVQRILCSGSGALRLITYLQCQDKIIGVDDMEKKRIKFDARPYALANQQFKNYPIFGEFRGHDNPEIIMGFDPLPQVIFKTFHTMGYDPAELQEKTEIPVITLAYGDFANKREQFYQALTIVGKVMKKEERARQVILFFKSQIEELEQRTKDISEKDQKSCFVGGVASKGPHGFQSTEPLYPPFQFVNVVNVATTPDLAGKNLSHSNISKEKLIQWDPEILFIDLSTLQMGEKTGGLYELKTDPVFQAMSAVEKNDVFGLLPYNWYAQNFGSILANAWFIGKLIHADRFKDIDPEKKADEIYTFLVGKPVYKTMNNNFQNLAFKRVALSDDL
ncbi:MAG: iron ABC transporter substrate-binding protein [Thermodesulfobacteriota bacterium]|nr:iron ABC transporter substrate-binding protein [Thermodesulfobacteriota bacterium]